MKLQFSIRPFILLPFILAASCSPSAKEVMTLTSLTSEQQTNEANNLFTNTSSNDINLGTPKLSIKDIEQTLQEQTDLILDEITGASTGITGRTFIQGKTFGDSYSKIHWNLAYAYNFQMGKSYKIHLDGEDVYAAVFIRDAQTKKFKFLKWVNKTNTARFTYNANTPFDAVVYYGFLSKKAVPFSVTMSEEGSQQMISGTRLRNSGHVYLLNENKEKQWMSGDLAARLNGVSRRDSFEVSQSLLDTIKSGKDYVIPDNTIVVNRKNNTWYKIENRKRHWIPNGEVAKHHQISLDDALEVHPDELQHYPPGETLKSTYKAVIPVKNQFSHDINFNFGGQVHTIPAGVTRYFYQEYNSEDGSVSLTIGQKPLDFLSLSQEIVLSKALGLSSGEGFVISGSMSLTLDENGNPGLQFCFGGGVGSALLGTSVSLETCTQEKDPQIKIKVLHVIEIGIAAPINGCHLKSLSYTLFPNPCNAFEHIIRLDDDIPDRVQFTRSVWFTGQVLWNNKSVSNRRIVITDTLPTNYQMNIPNSTPIPHRIGFATSDSNGRFSYNYKAFDKGRKTIYFLLEHPDEKGAINYTLWAKKEIEVHE